MLVLWFGVVAEKHLLCSGDGCIDAPRAVRPAPRTGRIVLFDMAAVVVRAVEDSYTRIVKFKK